MATTATKYFVYNKNNNLESHHPILIQKIPVYGRPRKLILFEQGTHFYCIMASKFDGAAERYFFFNISCSCDDFNQF